MKPYYKLLPVKQNNYKEKLSLHLLHKLYIWEYVPLFLF